MVDHYSIIEVPRNASASDKKKTYKKLAIVCFVNTFIFMISIKILSLNFRDTKSIKMVSGGKLLYSNSLLLLLESSVKSSFFSEESAEMLLTKQVFHNPTTMVLSLSWPIVYRLILRHHNSNLRN